MKRRTAALQVMTMLCVFMTGSVAYGFNEADLAALKATKSCSRCDLSETDLSGASLAGSNLSWTNLSGANLSGANLTGANLYETVLSGANLADAKLSGAIWKDGITCKQGSVGQCNH